MPLYEYKCKKCGDSFELFHRISEDASNLPCPKCGEKGPIKQMSAVSSTNKGNGSAVGSSPAPSCGRGGFGGFS